MYMRRLYVIALQFSQFVACAHTHQTHPFYTGLNSFYVRALVLSSIVNNSRGAGHLKLAKLPYKTEQNETYWRPMEQGSSSEKFQSKIRLSHWKYEPFSTREIKKKYLRSFRQQKSLIISHVDMSAFDI